MPNGSVQSDSCKSCNVPAIIDPLLRNFHVCPILWPLHGFSAMGSGAMSRHAVAHVRYRTCKVIDKAIPFEMPSEQHSLPIKLLVGCLRPSV